MTPDELNAARELAEDMVVYGADISELAECVQRLCAEAANPIDIMTPGCVKLKNGQKIVIQRHSGQSWLELKEPE